MVTFVESLQPYNGGGRDDPLARLNWLSNTDKHKVVHTTVATSPETTPIVSVVMANHAPLRLHDMTFYPGRHLQSDAHVEILRARIPKNIRPAPTDEVHVEFAPLQITFSERSLDVLDLREISRRVEDVLFGASELFLPES